MAESRQDRDRTYERAGWGRPGEWGSAPALIVVDLSRGFTEGDSPLGEDLSEVVAASGRLMSAARDRGLPIFLTKIVFQTADLEGGSAWLRKAPGMGILAEGTELVEFDPRLPIQDEDMRIVKRGASAFFGTDLAAALVARGVDTTIICGATTSGCVRATVVDALQSGFAVVVPRECVGDRAQGPHEANLFDIDAKYGDVVPLERALEYVALVGREGLAG